jgi:hypothetical protein
MLEETASCINSVEIFVPLRNEGTNVWRPTQGQPIGEMRFKVLPTPGYSPDLEEWEFPPGTVVKCKIEKRQDREVLIACSRQN